MIKKIFDAVLSAIVIGGYFSSIVIMCYLVRENIRKLFPKKEPEHIFIEQPKPTKNASQRFKKLGYEDTFNGNFEGCAYYCLFDYKPVTKEVIVGDQTVRKHEIEMKLKKYIYFCADDKEVFAWSKNDDGQVHITPEELEAIYTKVIELGWLKNGSN